MNNSFYEFKEIYNDLKNQKIGDLCFSDITKYLLVISELNWVDVNIGDDKLFFDYDMKLLENLSYTLEDSFRDLINMELYKNNLHIAPKQEECLEGNDYEFR